MGNSACKGFGDGLRLMLVAQGWGFRQEGHKSDVASSGLAWPLLGHLLLLLSCCWLFSLRILQFGKTPGDASANARGWVQVRAEHVCSLASLLCSEDVEMGE